MAQKAKKDRAKSNAVALNNLHIGSAVVNVVFILFRYIFKSRSLTLYIMLSIPALICEIVLERAGRPVYDRDTKALRTAGEDMAAPGLTEYMFDIVWVTWASVAVVLLFGNWGWLLWLAVPAYGAYQGYSLLGMRSKMAEMSGAEEPPAMNRKQRRAA
jgi:SRP-independent targeting protein 2/TMEM208